MVLEYLLRFAKQIHQVSVNIRYKVILQQMQHMPTPAKRPSGQVPGVYEWGVCNEWKDDLITEFHISLNI